MKIYKVVEMTRLTCISCGSFIVRSSTIDPYMCIDCEKILEGAEDRERHMQLEVY